MIIQLWFLWLEINFDDWLENDGTLTIFDLTVHKCDICASFGITLFGVQIIIGFTLGGGDDGEPSEPEPGTQSKD